MIVARESVRPLQPQLQKLSEKVAAFAAVDPLAHVCMTAVQRRWIWMGSPEDPEGGVPLCWRAGNQIGKSWAQAAKIIHYIRKTGPYANRRAGGVNVLIISTSKEQIIPLMAKLDMLMPKAELGAGVAFKPGFGFVGKPPRIEWVCGPGQGSLISFATYSQNSTRIAGDTVDVVVLDEPPPESMWSEVVMRIMRRGGQVWASYTPTPESPPVDYLLKMVKDGEVREIQTSLCVEALTPEDTVGPPFLSQAQIDKFLNKLLPVERPMREHGDPNPLPKGRVLTLFGPHCIQRSSPPVGAILAVGIDHANRAGRQAAALVAIVKGKGRPKVWILEESISNGATTMEEDARQIKAMLDRRGLSWHHIDHWYGDRAAVSSKTGAQKDNKAMRAHLISEFGLGSRENFPWIIVPHKPPGSVFSGLRLMNSLMAEENCSLFIAPHLEHTIGACKGFEWNPKDPRKDILDAIRYPIQNIVNRGDWESQTTIYKVRP